jgi:hypothetical protein
MLARLVLYATLGTLTSVLGYTVYSTEFWCFLGLFWAVDTLGRLDGFDSGMQTARALLVKANELLNQAQDLRELKGYPRQDDRDIDLG